MHGKPGSAGPAADGPGPASAVSGPAHGAGGGGGRNGHPPGALGTALLARIDLKILAVVGVVVTLGLMLLVDFFTDREETNILAQNRRTLIYLIESTEKGLKAMMLSGYGDTGPIFTESLDNLGEQVDLQVLHTNGLAAFSDNRTIAEVNEQLGYRRFEPRASQTFRQIVPTAHPALQEALATGAVTEYRELDADGERRLTLLSPIPNEPDCEECHTGGERYRGVIKLTTSLHSVDADIDAGRRQALLILFVTVLAIMAAISLFLRRTVIPPIRRITDAMQHAAHGDLAQNIPVPRQLELGTMADSFNRMTRELRSIYSGLERERNKLTTIILGAREGIVLTDRSGRVVLVNPACETLLEKPAAEIVAGGLLGLFDHPDWVAQRLSATTADGGVTDTIHYQGQVLSVHLACIDNERGEPIGSAALIRDITQQHRLRQRLRNLSHTDPLTGLSNRRHFDEVLHAEFARAKRYGTTLALVIFDIDHFKRFNDEHGHDQGDRVLQAVAENVRESFREIDLVCRYGGEEFTVVMPEADAARACEQAEWARQTIEKLRVDGLQVTCSFGVAQFDDTGHQSPEALLKAADEALYEAKESGRNRVCLRRPG